LSPLLVSLPLTLPVSFRPRRIVLAQLHPTAGVFRAPLLSAVQAHLSVHGIGGGLSPVVIVTAPSLAVGIATDGLSGPELGWRK